MSTSPAKSLSVTSPPPPTSPSTVIRNLRAISTNISVNTSPKTAPYLSKYSSPSRQLRSAIPNTSPNKTTFLITMSGPPPPGPPPPPPPPPPPAPPANDGPDLGDMASALFAEINSLGEAGARSGLKKGVRGPVNDEVPVDNKPAPTPIVAPVVKKKSAFANGDPICSISGKKWSIENQVDNHELVIEVESMKHTVYVYRCEKSTIQIKGKVNSISIDKCKKVALVFEDALSQVEIVNSDSIQVQCTGNAPSINIDGCQSVTYYMSQESVDNAMVITSKSAAINLIRPHPDDPDDIVETPIPEQFCTTFKDGSFVTEAVEHDD